MTIFECLAMVSLAVASVVQTWAMSKIAERLDMLERTLALKDFIDCINNGESPSDIAYMREKGFIK